MKIWKLLIALVAGIVTISMVPVEDVILSLAKPSPEALERLEQFNFERLAKLTIEFKELKGWSPKDFAQVEHFAQEEGYSIQCVVRVLPLSSKVR